MKNIRVVSSVLALLAASLVATQGVNAAGADQVRGFVFNLRPDIPAGDADFGECPDGLSVSTPEHLLKHGTEAQKKVQKEYKELEKEGNYVAAFKMQVNDCADPSLIPNPTPHTLFEGQADVGGLDLDGVDSKAGKGGQCAHDDFLGRDGKPGIDNQLWRLWGCTEAYQPGGAIERTSNSTGAGATGTSNLMELKLVEGSFKDGRVEGRIYSGQFPVKVDTQGRIISGMSHPISEDTAYHSDTFTGEIKNGVLTTGLVDTKLRLKIQSIDYYWHFKDLRIQANINEDGSLAGEAGAYWDAENLYGNLTSVINAYGMDMSPHAANNLGYSCSAVYQALPKVADGHPDADGNCTSISTGFKFTATPGFIIHPANDQAAK